MVEVAVIFKCIGGLADGRLKFVDSLFLLHCAPEGILIEEKHERPDHNRCEKGQGKVSFTPGTEFVHSFCQDVLTVMR